MHGNSVQLEFKYYKSKRVVLSAIIGKFIDFSDLIDRLYIWWQKRWLLHTINIYLISLISIVTDGYIFWIN